MAKFSSYGQAHSAWEQNKKEIENFYAALRKVTEEVRSAKTKKYDYISKYSDDSIYFYYTRTRSVTLQDIKRRSLQEILEDANVSISQFRTKLEESEEEIREQREIYREPEEDRFFSEENYLKSLQNYKEFIQKFDDFFTELRRQAGLSESTKEKQKQAQNDPSFHSISTWWYSSVLKQQFKSSSSQSYTPDYFQIYSKEELNGALKELSLAKEFRLKDFSTSKPTKRAFSSQLNYENYLEQWQANYDEFVAFYGLLQSSIKLAINQNFAIKRDEPRNKEAAQTEQAVPKAKEHSFLDALPVSEWNSQSLNQEVTLRDIWEKRSDFVKRFSKEQFAEALNEFKKFDTNTRKQYKQLETNTDEAGALQKRFAKYNNFSNALKILLEKASGQFKESNVGLQSPNDALAKLREILPPESFDSDGELKGIFLTRIGKERADSPERNAIRDALLPKEASSDVTSTMSEILPYEMMKPFDKSEDPDALQRGVEEGVEFTSRIFTNLGKPAEIYTDNDVEIKPNAVQRGGCEWGTTIRISSRPSRDLKEYEEGVAMVTTHELGHAYEHNTFTKSGERITESIGELLLKMARTDENGRPMTNRFPPPYKANERYFVLKPGYSAPSKYMVKAYLDSSSHVFSSEVVSMTFQYLYESPEVLLKKEYRTFFEEVFTCLKEALPTRPE